MGTLTRLPRFARGTFRKELDRMFDEFFPEFESEEETMWTPRMDVAETDDAYSVMMDLPGIAKEDIKVDLKEGLLSVSGERKHEEEETKADYRRMERAYGSFYRAVTLPKTVTTEGVEATFKEGVLSIHIPKVEEEEEAKRIEIK